MLSSRILRAGVALSLMCGLLLLAGGAGLGAAYDVVTPPRLKPGDAVPAPQGRIVLTVHGAMAHPNDHGKLAFDRATLERIGLIRYTCTNRWYQQPVTFEGVLGSAFLDIVGVPPGATMLYMRALNDYTVRIPISDFRRWPVMLALKLNGEYMSVRNKGPVWVVYPTHIDPALGGDLYQGRWIWQLVDITFE